MELVRKIIISVIIYCFILISLYLSLNFVVSVDRQFFLLINSLANPYLLLFFNLITYLGSSILWIFLIILFWLKNKKNLSFHLFYAFVLDTIFLFIFKNIFLRPRPFETFHLENTIDFDMGPSFPSGHSERAFSGAVVLSNYYKKYRILFYALSSLVAFSRIYIGFHYPLDAIIGSVNGILIGIIVLAMPTKKIGLKV